MVDIMRAPRVKDLDLDARLQVDPKDLVSILNENEKELICLKSLFVGGWNEMIEALERRLEAPPYILNLAVRIKADIKTVTKLRDYELKHNVELDTYLG